MTADHGDLVVIVGAGLCGLVTAYELHRRGIPCVVLEAADHAGGRLRTIRLPDGAVAEAGMEEFWETSPAYELLRRFDLPLRDESAWSSVILDGRLSVYSDVAGTGPYFDHLFPGQDADGFARWNELAWDLLDEFAGRGSAGGDGLDPDLHADDFASFVIGLCLPTRVQSWIRLHVETESAVEWHRISVLDGLHEMLPFLVPRVGSSTPRTVRVSGGNGRLVDALMDRLPAGTVRFGTRVTSAAADGARGGVEVRTVTSDGRDAVVRGHHAVLTTPLWSLRSLEIRPQLSHEACAALASARFGSYVKVILRLRSDRLRMCERDGEHPFTLLTDGPAGCIYLTDGRADGRDHVLTMLVHGRSARACHGRPHDHIVRRTISELERLDATDDRRHRRRIPLLQDLRASVTSALVVAHPRAVAYWPHALGRSRFDALAASLREPHGRILIGGDTTETSHSDGAVRAGQRMANTIAGRIDSRGRVPA